MNRWAIFVRPLRGLMMKTSFMNNAPRRAAEKSMRSTNPHETSTKKALVSYFVWIRGSFYCRLPMHASFSAAC
jgi:hypothetical protein